MNVKHPSTPLERRGDGEAINERERNWGVRRQK